MVLTIKKGMEKEQLDLELKKIQRRKVLVASKHLGKVKWNEDPLEYQKRLRDEWN
jgi:hypothetical protein